MVRLKGLEPTHISVREPKSRMSTNSITGADRKKPRCLGSRVWSGQRGSNSLPPPWQGGALPDELCPRQRLLFYHKILPCQVFFRSLFADPALSAAAKEQEHPIFSGVPAAIFLLRGFLQMRDFLPFPQIAVFLLHPHCRNRLHISDIH